MPASRRGEWEHLLTIEDVREKRTKLEEYLDRGMGECQLREPRIARLCEDALLFFHNERYELLAWCVLLNHVPVLVHVWQMPLWRRDAHSFWKREYWDTFMRDKDQEKTAIRYIESDPVKAKLCRAADDWQFGSARFRDEYRRLVIRSP